MVTFRKRFKKLRNTKKGGKVKDALNYITAKRNEIREMYKNKEKNKLPEIKYSGNIYKSCKMDLYDFIIYELDKMIKLNDTDVYIFFYKFLSNHRTLITNILERLERNGGYFTRFKDRRKDRRKVKTEELSYFSTICSAGLLDKIKEQNDDNPDTAKYILKKQIDLLDLMIRYMDNSDVFDNNIKITNLKAIVEKERAGIRTFPSSKELDKELEKYIREKRANLEDIPQLMQDQLGRLFNRQNVPIDLNIELETANKHLRILKDARIMDERYSSAIENLFYIKKMENPEYRLRSEENH